MWGARAGDGHGFFGAKPMKPEKKPMKDMGFMWVDDVEFPTIIKVRLRHLDRLSTNGGLMG